MFKVVQNPKTGKMETVDVVEKATPESLAELHKEVRDMLDGNTQFHVDPLAKPKPAPPLEEENPYGWVLF